jgi:hypothetical protein
MEIGVRLLATLSPTRQVIAPFSGSRLSGTPDRFEVTDVNDARESTG